MNVYSSLSVKSSLVKLIILDKVDSRELWLPIQCYCKIQNMFYLITTSLPFFLGFIQFFLISHSTAKPSSQFFLMQLPRIFTQGIQHPGQYSQSRILLPPFCMFRRILHTSVNAQNPAVSIPLFNPPRSKPPHSEIGRSLLCTQKSFSIDLSLQKSRILLYPKENRNS